MNIRRFEIADLKIGFLETLSCLRDVDLSPEQAELAFNGYLVDGQSHIYVVQDEGKIIATGTLLIEYSFLHGFSTIAHLENIVVHVDHQGHFIGGLLVNHLVNEARKLGCYKVILDCSKELVPFYERAGFKKSDIHMRLDLND